MYCTTSPRWVKGRGRKLGYPTANIPAPAPLEDGIYVGYTFSDEHKLPSLVFVGASITFDETDRKAEIYALDFDGDLYGKSISVELQKKLRGNKRFESEEALVAQMKRDEQEARAYFT
ncbi:riboflavin kinase [Candidatus Microgenomates bacterium]|nr:riboflavin kinase [Candidatus Microgenomates bacterium]